jgi:hypothetical protein
VCDNTRILGLCPVPNESAVNVGDGCPLAAGIEPA